AATIVVACGRSPADRFGPFTLFAPGSRRHEPPGSSCGAYDDKSSANDDDPKSWRGTLRPHRSRYIPRLLSQPTGTRALRPPYALAHPRRERRIPAGRRPRTRPRRTFEPTLFESAPTPPARCRWGGGPPASRVTRGLHPVRVTRRARGS